MKYGGNICSHKAMDKKSRMKREFHVRFCEGLIVGLKMGCVYVFSVRQLDQIPSTLLLNSSPVQNHLNSGTICRAFANMMQTYDPGRVNKHITAALKDIAC